MKALVPSQSVSNSRLQKPVLVTTFGVSAPFGDNSISMPGTFTVVGVVTGTGVGFRNFRCSPSAASAARSLFSHFNAVNELSVHIIVSSTYTSAAIDAGCTLVASLRSARPCFIAAQYVAIADPWFIIRASGWDDNFRLLKNFTVENFEACTSNGVPCIFSSRRVCQSASTRGIDAHDTESKNLVMSYSNMFVQPVVAVFRSLSSLPSSPDTKLREGPPRCIWAKRGYRWCMPFRHRSSIDEKGRSRTLY